MRIKLAGQLQEAAGGIGTFLAAHIKAHAGFASRTFYAEAFALNLLETQGKLSAPLETLLSQAIQEKKRSNSQFHGEFLQYPQQNWKGYPFKTHAVTNWVLLRSLLNTRYGRRPRQNIEAAKQVMRRRQEGSGLIKDDSDVRSFQYHSFSLVLLFDFWQETQDPFFRSAFQSGIHFIKNFISPDGSALYVGRGQEQLFGYSSLIYALSAAQELDDLEKVTAHLKRFRRADGSFPLVLREGEEPAPFKPDLMSEKYLGWYGYNNYFDYLAFAGFFLQKAADHLKEKSGPAIDQGRIKEEYFDGTFRRMTKKRYQAVIALPGGALSNALAFPFITSHHRGALTPCFGGEAFINTLAKKTDCPLPYFPLFDRTLQSRSASWMTKSALHMLSPLGYMKRAFQWEDTSLIISTRVRSPFSYTHQYLFFDEIQVLSEKTLVGNGYEIHSNHPLSFIRHAYCPLGKLKVFTCSQPQSVLRLRLLDEAQPVALEHFQ